MSLRRYMPLRQHMPPHRPPPRFGFRPCLVFAARLHLLYTLHNIFGIIYCSFWYMYGTCIVLFGPCKKCYLLHSIEYCTSSFKLRRCVPALALAMYFSSAPLYSASRATPLTADGTNCNFIIKTSMNCFKNKL